MWYVNSWESVDILLKTRIKTETETMIRQKEVDGLIALEVTPIGMQKSFYGKAWEILVPEDDAYVLVSYGRNVARLYFTDYENGVMIRLWDGYSQTTMRHINSWLQWHGMNPITKKQWQEMEVVL